MKYCLLLFNQILDNRVKMFDITSLSASYNYFFLGLEFDSVAEVVRLPEDKLERCREGISRILKSAQPSSNKKRACTLRELQSILGLLSFACSVIIPGRAFLKRLFALTAGIKKPYHFVKITQAAREDLNTWLFFPERV